MNFPKFPPLDFDLEKPAYRALAVSLISTVAFFVYKSNRRASRLKAIQATNANAVSTYFAPSASKSNVTVPVAIFLGGTAGIGRGMAEAFARYTNGNAHIIILGRNEANAKAIISTFPKPTVHGARHEFVQCDATLMAECERVLQDLRARLPRINYLVISPMLVKTFGEEKTTEGKEPKLVLMYYARFKFIKELTGALEKAKEQGEEAKVYIVGGAGLGKSIDWDDLGFRKKGYSFLKIRAQFPLYMTVILQEFAARSPSLTFIDSYPGPVRSALGDNLRWMVARFLYKVLFSATFPFSYSESGEYMLHAMLTTAKTPGVWNVGMYGSTLPISKIYQASEKERKILWEHSVEETSIQ
ncbi:hypothetical protein BDP27DRAFT_1315405 [Rhodocollybia butyracea]|uniref:NAD(P)-binding protein n=1 Tax=Rhodocollybia butyracea TaxID=206335 RepID=A0A9P5Q8H4_9AGAR|nr:hypothetical protein BDP27DRAFT_1315405 [Rhodocollybia butyracea]